MPTEANNYTIVLETSNNVQETIIEEMSPIIEEMSVHEPVTNESTKINGITNFENPIEQDATNVPIEQQHQSTDSNSQNKDKTKLHECEVCHIKFQRSYQLKRHKFIGIHEFKNNDQPLVSPTKTQLSPSKIQSSPVVQEQVSNFNDIIEETIIAYNENIKNDLPIVYQVYYEDENSIATPIIIKENCSSSYSTEVADENDETDSLACEYCHANFELIDHLDSHLQQHNRKGFYRCELCDAKFNYVEILKNHVTSHVFHKPYKCELCEKSFNEIAVLKVHLKTHRDEKNFRFKCHRCNEMLLDNEQLTAHLYMHNGIKAFKCEWCSRVFIHNVILKKHISMHHT